MKSQSSFENSVGLQSSFKNSTGWKDRLASVLKDKPDLQRKLLPAWTPYIPHKPTPRQLAFLCLTHREALYGGAAGGGKSDALLMGALQYVNVPGYSALILRKTFTDLSQPGALIDRSHDWLDGTPAVWRPQLHRWDFPTGGRPATLQFGYLQSALDVYRYQSAEFQYIAIDELTQHYEWDYLFLFSRCRRPRCPDHADKPHPRCPTCAECAALARVPLRVRSATNPGGIGHRWVKERFGIRQVTDPRTGQTRWLGSYADRPYIPAYIQDNPYIDQQSYILSLHNLDPVTREQYLSGDWSITHEGRIKPSWARYYTIDNKTVYLKDNQRNTVLRTWPLARCRVFCTADTAASVREGPADKLLWRREPSWTVLATWLVTPDHDLLLYDILRFQKEIPDIIRLFKQRFQELCQKGLQPEFIGIEAAAVSLGIIQTLRREGLPIRPLSPYTGDKLVRATDFINRMEQGKVYFLQDAPWLPAYENELYTWVGDPAQAADQIDASAYAGREVTRWAGSTTTVVRRRSDLPRDLPGSGVIRMGRF